MAKKVILAADHGGFSLKEKIKGMLTKSGYRVEDAGTYSARSCDYPEFGFSAAKQVSSRKADRAIVICKTGIGMSIIANKLPGVRAGLCGSVSDAVSSRQHNDTNVLVLAAKRVSAKKAMDTVRAWLRTRALKGRHAKRVRQIKELEKKVFKRHVRGS
ncbi:MAG: RpiB/LacA/LacB family sugar-phosphate isomerase [Candidatus Omnitrophota bacterium]|nr:RpiB/LacA/LacB family sugar-phosphate isomerase [Candidatus Omnitrophota bacterium]